MLLHVITHPLRIAAVVVPFPNSSASQVSLHYNLQIQKKLKTEIVHTPLGLRLFICPAVSSPSPGTLLIFCPCVCDLTGASALCAAWLALHFSPSAFQKSLGWQQPSHMARQRPLYYTLHSHISGGNWGLFYFAKFREKHHVVSVRKHCDGPPYLICYDGKRWMKSSFIAIIKGQNWLWRWLICGIPYVHSELESQKVTKIWKMYKNVHRE